ncbi:MAG: UDP-N-acetylmuramate dehydrogenase [Dehalococcoidia bacterium]
MHAMTRREARPGEMYEELADRLQPIAPVRREEPLARHTTFGIGGPADVFVSVRNAGELALAVVETRRAGAPYFILGSGSNILVGDLGIRGVVIDNQAKHVTAPHEVDGEWTVRAESGTSFAALARNLARQGFGGIEWACGIPGTLGGAVVYNAGAYDGSIADVLRFVSMLTADEQTKEVQAPDLKLTYRNSVFTRGECEGCVVLATQLVVTRGDATALVRRIAEIDAQRLAAQPRGRNSGSTFKNPDGRHAWELVDAVGLRGHRIGDAMFSNKHANFIENLGAASAADVTALIREAQRRVNEHHGIGLVTEVEFVGEGFA